jgi:hypothetical protein
MNKNTYITLLFLKIRIKEKQYLNCEVVCKSARKYSWCSLKVREEDSVEKKAILKIHKVINFLPTYFFIGPMMVAMTFILLPGCMVILSRVPGHSLQNFSISFV